MLDSVKGYDMAQDAPSENIAGMREEPVRFLCCIADVYETEITVTL
jgi:hypothetical protein